MTTVRRPPSSRHACGSAARARRSPRAGQWQHARPTLRPAPLHVEVYASTTQPADAASPDNTPAWLKGIIGESEYSTAFRLRRWVLFSGLVLGYSFYYLCRNSLNYVTPTMVADTSLGLSITQVATMTSIFPIAYGASKFISGVLGARTSPRLLLAVGLMSTASINIMFGFSSSLLWFCVLWAINGTLQGFGGPSCARMLTTWFASRERGTYWGLWNIAHNLGGFLAPIIAGFAAREFGWRWGMFVPGMMGIAMGFYVLLATGDSPEKLGYPPVEKLDQAKAKAQAAAAGKAKAEDKPSMLQVLVQTVLRNPFIWGMAVTYFFIYVIRQGVTTWSVFFLIGEKGIVDTAQAAFMVSGLEIGGLVGSLLAGRLADAMVNAARNPLEEGNVGKRVRVVMFYTVGIAASLIAFRFAPCIGWLQWAIVFMLGFFIYGPQMLIGLCGAELVGPESVGASEGFLGWIAYLGAANAGIPLSLIVKNYGWDAFFRALVIACGFAFVLMAPMVNLKSHVQREQIRVLKQVEIDAGNVDVTSLDVIKNYSGEEGKGGPAAAAA